MTFIHSAAIGGTCFVAGAELSPGSREGWRGHGVSMKPVVLSLVRPQAI